MLIRRITYVKVGRCICRFRQHFKCLKRHVSSAAGDASNHGAPLAGIRVLDISRILAGPYCSMILGDLGADIIKVERPGQGDDTRIWGPPFCGTESAYFFAVNRNKRSIAIDMKKPEGAAIVKQLARTSDVLLENYLPGKLSEMGLGYEDLKKEAPQLIYCSITGYGQTGPYSDRAGYDVISAGVGGLMHITGPEDGAPCKTGVALMDLSTGLYAHGAIMAALLQRVRTGTGQHIDCNLLSTTVASLVNIGCNYLNAGWEAKRHGTAHASIVPYQAFATSTGYIVIGGGNDLQFKRLCKIMSLAELSDDPRYESNKLRVQNRKILLDILSKRFLEKSTDDWMGIFDGSGLPYGPINNMETVFSDPQVLHNKMIQEMDHPSSGKIRVPGPAVSYSDYTSMPFSPPPTLGQHTENILQEVLQMDEKEIQHLRNAAVIQ